MNLLIVTQVVDRTDPVLGFFHRWIEEFSKRYDHIIVICLKEGEHTLPKNVQVFSLGKEQGRRFKWDYALRFLRLIWVHRSAYETIFVHMNQEYVLLGGVFWKIWKKRSVLWRNHKMGSWLTRLAGILSTHVCYTSPAAYVARFKNSVQMPVGIDTQLFATQSSVPKKSHSILFLGRFDRIKRPEIFLSALELLNKEKIEFVADIFGEPTQGNEVYAQKVKKEFISLPNTYFNKGVPFEETLSLYGSHEIYVNLTPSGSFDKTIGEAIVAGCIVVTANSALKEVLPEGLMLKNDSIHTLAEALKTALTLNGTEKQQIILTLSSWIYKNHSLNLLMEKLIGLFE